MRAPKLILRWDLTAANVSTMPARSPARDHLHQRDCQRFPPDACSRAGHATAERDGPARRRNPTAPLATNAFCRRTFSAQ